MDSHYVGSFVPSSATTSSSFRDAIASYRRAQFLVVGSTVASVSDEEAVEEDDEEAQVGLIEEEEPETPRPPSDQDEHEHDLLFEWADDLDDHEHHLPSHPNGVTSRPLATPFLPSSQRSTVSPPPAPITNENTPLLQKVSFGSTPYPHRSPSHSPAVGPSPPIHGDESSYFPDPSARRPVIMRPTIRRPSTTSLTKSIKHTGGQSTYGQTLFNSIAILLGIGLLSEPLAFSYAGWVLGTTLLIFYGFISCYTAKMLAKVILSDNRLRSYSDIGRKAFGPRSTMFISLLFCLELFSVSVILVTLYADSLHSVIPTYSSTTYKLWGLILLIPTVFLPLSLLSYTSILGILSTVFLLVVVLADGLTKRDSPGSLWQPSPTSVGPAGAEELGIAFGLFMAGFSGHAVIPSLARDMVHPEQFDQMINWAFAVATSIYIFIGAVGYVMFGNTVSEEVSLDLLKTPGYSKTLNQAALWMLVISPLSKFALTTQPLNATLEVILRIDSPMTSPEAVARKLSMPVFAKFSFKRFLAVIQRILLTGLSVAVSILVPEFGSMMAFLGSFSAFVLCIIGPVAAKIAIEKKCGWFDGGLLLMAIVMAVWGTLVAFT